MAYVCTQSLQSWLSEFDQRLVALRAEAQRQIAAAAQGRLDGDQLRRFYDLLKLCHGRAVAARADAGQSAFVAQEKGEQADGDIASLVSAIEATLAAIHALAPSGLVCTLTADHTTPGRPVVFSAGATAEYRAAAQGVVDALA